MLHPVGSQPPAVYWRRRLLVAASAVLLVVLLALTVNTLLSDGGGSPAAMKQEIWRHYPVGSKVELVERLLDRGVLHDPKRPITANREPGKCCDTGCTGPGQAVMVPMPGGRK